MPRITLTVSEEERKALSALAQNEYRDPHSQAVLILRQRLEALGLVEPMTRSTNTSIIAKKAGSKPPAAA